MLEYEAELEMFLFSLPAIALSASMLFSYCQYKGKINR
jgi:hypothetical protein